MSLDHCPGSITSHAQNDRTGRCCWCGTRLYPPVPCPPLRGWRTNLDQEYRRHYDPDYGTNPSDT